MSESSAAPSVELSVLDAHDALQAAVALGLPVPALAGTTVFEARMYADRFETVTHHDRTLGLFTTQEKALLALNAAMLAAFDPSSGRPTFAPWVTGLDTYQALYACQREAGGSLRARRLLEPLRAAWLEEHPDLEERLNAVTRERWWSVREVPVQ